MNPKLKPEHVSRTAVVYVRQSSMGQVEHHTESKRRQYSLADSAASLGFASYEPSTRISVVQDPGLSTGLDFRSSSDWSAAEA
jgi:hypothetical protein